MWVLVVTAWTVARQAFLSMEFSRQEYWSGLPFPSPEELPNPGIEPWSPASQADSIPFELQGISLEVDGKCLCPSVIGNALGKCQLVVDRYSDSSFLIFKVRPPTSVIFIIIFQGTGEN